MFQVAKIIDLIKRLILQQLLKILVIFRMYYISLEKSPNECNLILILIRNIILPIQKLINLFSKE